MSDTCFLSAALLIGKSRFQLWKTPELGEAAVVKGSKGVRI